MTPPEIALQIRQLIASGQLEDAADQLVYFFDEELLSKTDKTQFQLYNQALHQLSQLNELKHAELAGVISRDDADMKRNKIRSALLEITEALRKSRNPIAKSAAPVAAMPESSFPRKKVIIGALFLAGALLLFLAVRYFATSPAAPAESEAEQFADTTEAAIPESTTDPEEELVPAVKADFVVGKNQRYVMLQMAVDAAPDGSSIAITEGEYSSTTPVVISGKSDLTITGIGAVSLLCSDKDQDVVQVKNSRNIRFENLTAKHTNPPKDSYCTANVFHVSDTEDLTIINSDVNGCGTVGLNANNVRGIHLENNIFHRNSDGGIYINGGTARLINNRFDNNGIHFYFNGEFLVENKNMNGLEMSGNQFLSPPKRK